MCEGNCRCICRCNERLGPRRGCIDPKWEEEFKKAQEEIEKLLLKENKRADVR